MKFLSHINKHRKWYLLGIGVAWLLVALFVPVYTYHVSGRTPWHNTILSELDGATRGNPTMTILSVGILFLVPALLLVSSLLKPKLSKIFALITIATMLVFTFLFIYKVTKNNDQLVHVTLHAGTYILAFLFILTTTITLSLRHLHTPRKPSRKQQISDLQRPIDELKQDQEQKHD